MSPRRNWDTPTPSLARECGPPPRTGGGGANSPAGEGVGESQLNSDDWSKILALCLLCGLCDTMFTASVYDSQKQVSMCFIKENEHT
jgi:hypothetical protein